MEERKYIVYIHKNKINGKVYVGITHYTNPKKRWLSGYGYRGSHHFQAAINKYGWDNFEHIILFKNIQKELACREEQLLIKRYKKKGVCYNIANGGEGSEAMSEEIIEKLKEYKGPLASQYGKKHSLERIEQQREGSYRIWRNLSDKERENRLRGVRKHQFKSGKEHPNYGKSMSKENKNIIIKALSKPVLMIDKNTNEVLKEFDSTTEAETFLNAKGKHVSCCCNNKRKTAYGYKWKYKEE
jgi:group I intron endonuclease